MMMMMMIDAVKKPSFPKVLGATTLRPDMRMGRWFKMQRSIIDTKCNLPRTSKVVQATKSMKS